MTAQGGPEVTLYDLTCTKNVCFSPVVWRIRLMLNYKQIPYKTIFLEFPDIEPTLKELGLDPGDTASGGRNKYTVPAIHHIPTGTYLMESSIIAQFLESTYPDRPVPLTSELGQRIEAEARAAISPGFRTSLMPRETYILSPRGQEYFRRTREAALGHPLEDMLAEPGIEERTWSAAGDAIRAVSELMLTHSASGRFVLGEQPSYTDFTVAGSLQCARVVDEEVFQRVVKYPGFRRVYDACLPYMDKKN